jgi:hypothetical protein
VGKKMVKYRKKPVEKKKAKKSPLEKVLEFIYKDLHRFDAYAGGAYLRGNIADMHLWKGQYIALERLRKYVADLIIQESIDA